MWHIQGGHRLWSAPEATPRSYSLDDKPVKVEVQQEAIKIYGNPEIQNSVQKEILIKKSGEDSIEITHKIKNIGRWKIEFACWALTVVKKGGFAILPIKRGMEGLLPDRNIVLWPYTLFSDKRIIIDKDIIFLKQDENISAPCKIGVSANPAWTGYWVDGMLFVKKFFKQKGVYPDNGCSVEVYTNADMLELETLSVLQQLEPGETAEHNEVWSINMVPDLSAEQKDFEKKAPGLLT